MTSRGASGCAGARKETRRLGIDAGYSEDDVAEWVKTCDPQRVWMVRSAKRQGHVEFRWALDDAATSTEILDTEVYVDAIATALGWRRHSEARWARATGRGRAPRPARAYHRRGCTVQSARRRAVAGRAPGATVGDTDLSRPMGLTLLILRRGQDRAHVGVVDCRAGPLDQPQRERDERGTRNAHIVASVPPTADGRPRCLQVPAQRFADGAVGPRTGIQPVRQPAEQRQIEFSHGGDVSRRCGGAASRAGSRTGGTAA